MANPIFYYQSVENSTITNKVGSTNAAYALNNLKDRTRTSFFKSTSATGHETLFNYGSAIAVDSVVISDFTSSTALGANGIWVGYSTDDVSYTQFNSSFTGTPNTQMTNFTGVISAASQSKQYWDVQTNCGSAGTVEWSTIFLGTKYSFPIAPVRPGGKFGEYDFKSNLYLNKLSGGNKTSQKFYPAKRVWDWHFIMTAAQTTNLETVMIAIQGEHLPIWMADMDSNLVFCRVSMINKKEVTYAFHEFDLHIEEE